MQQNEMPDDGATLPWGVVIVEDDGPTRAFFEESIGRCTKLRWLASAGTVHDALSLLEGLAPAPDVLLVDLGLPDGSGLRVIQEAVARYPQCEPLVISVFGDEDNVLASIEAGAVGYIHKDDAPESIACTILDMKAGGSPISPMVARRVLAKYRSLQDENRPADAAPAPEAVDAAAAILPGRPLLSKREQEVLALIARGFSYAEIARLHALSVHTVQTHIKNLYGKLAVHSKNEAVFEAMRLGLLRHPG
ncbi:response regulator transcription factor [Variovorax sp. PBL-E5]|uniref:response regulator transcription factor n=2 Tax=unclassified Variovorax TaxID=663243 RepID=UPI0013A578A1|nr:response regulator transcription factor [Variovorax sp. PBL-E5]